MKKLYLDCDGVILDTIRTSYEILKKNNITGDRQIAEFYNNLDWGKLIVLSGEIDNSISKIKLLAKYFDIKILTHIHSSKEGESKKKYFSEKLPNIDVILVDKKIDKCDKVNPKGAILVDDFLDNLEKWEKKGGIGVKFSDSGKKSMFITIKDLLELLEINFDMGEKTTEILN